MGYFNDGIVRNITYQTGLTYSTLTSSVSTSSLGDVKGLIIGFDELKANYDFIYENVSNAKIVSASTIKNGGIAECLAKMSFGNKVGVEVVKEINLFSYDYGTLVVESVEELNFANAILIGKTTKAKEINILGESVSIDEAIKAYLGTFDHLYPRIVDETEKDLEIRDYKGTVNIIFA